MPRPAEWLAPDFPVVAAISDLRFNVIVQDDLLYLVALEMLQNLCSESLCLLSRML